MNSRKQDGVETPHLLMDHAHILPPTATLICAVRLAHTHTNPRTHASLEIVLSQIRKTSPRVCVAQDDPNKKWLKKEVATVIDSLPLD